MNVPEHKFHGEVLEEFELHGSLAQVVHLKPEDIPKKDLHALVENLTDVNFQPLDIPHSGKRMMVKEGMLRTRDALSHIPAIGTSIAKHPKWEEAGRKIYPDHTRGEHVRGYRKRYPSLAEKGQLLGIFVDGRLVAVQGFMQTGTAKSGRPVFEFNKASTLPDKSFQRQGLNSKLKERIFKKIMQEHPDAMWATASRNPQHIERFRRRGWHIVEMDDPHEAVQVMFQVNPEYHKFMISQGYKAIYFDPKVDTIKFDE